MAEYIVTVAEGVDWRSVHNDLIRDTSTDDSVDSNTVPDRVCECTLERPNSNRNTHYELTDQEAEQLRNDPRIEAITSITAKDIADKKLNYIQTINPFRMRTSSTGNNDNWALYRHTRTTTNEGLHSDFSLSNTSYNYVLDGTGVDVVIMDSGIQADHPEWQDANGVSRLKQIDWYAEAGVPNPGVDMVRHYTDQDGHGTHVASSVAGKKFGWAKNADIYSMKIDLDNSFDSPISTDPDIHGNTAFDILRLWHQNKGNNRPTVINMSWGYNVSTTTTTNPVQVHGYPISHIKYRTRAPISTNGWDGDDRHVTNLQKFGFTCNWEGVPYRYSPDDAELEDLLSAGAHVVVAAGNDTYKHELLNGPDYDNYVENSALGLRLYYHRGSSPYSTKAFNIGALSAQRDQSDSNWKDIKAYGFISTANRGVSQWGSTTGPAVDMYAAGQNIMGATKNGGAHAYYDDSNYCQELSEGSSMASPQVAGMIACLLQAHPNWTVEQVKEYMIASATNDMVDEHNGSAFNPNINGDSIWQNTWGLCGGANRVAYFPLHGNKPYGFNSSS